MPSKADIQDFIDTANKHLDAIGRVLYGNEHGTPDCKFANVRRLAVQIGQECLASGKTTEDFDRLIGEACFFRMLAHYVVRDGRVSGHPFHDARESWQRTRIKLELASVAELDDWYNEGLQRECRAAEAMLPEPLLKQIKDLTASLATRLGPVSDEESQAVKTLSEVISRGSTCDGKWNPMTATFDSKNA